MTTQNQLPEIGCIEPADRLDHWNVKLTADQCLEVSTAELSSNRKFLQASAEAPGRGGCATLSGSIFPTSAAKTKPRRPNAQSSDDVPRSPSNSSD